MADSKNTPRLWSWKAIRVSFHGFQVRVYDLFTVPFPIDLTPLQVTAILLLQSRSATEQEESSEDWGALIRLCHPHLTQLQRSGPELMWQVMVKQSSSKFPNRSDSKLFKLKFTKVAKLQGVKYAKFRGHLRPWQQHCSWMENILAWS